MPSPARHTMASTPVTPRTPAPERSPPPVPGPRPRPPPVTPPSPSPSSQPDEAYHTPSPVPAPFSPLQTTTPPSPSQPGEDYHTPTPSLDDASLPSDGREGAPAKSPQLSPLRLPSQHFPPPPSPQTGPNGQEGGATTAVGPAAPARPQIFLTGLARSPSQGSVATPSPSPTPPSPLTPAPRVNGNKSGQSTPRRAETWKPPLSPAAIAVQFDPVEEAVTSPLRLGNGKARLEHQQQQQQQPRQHAAESGGAVPPDVAAVAAVGERRALSVTLRLATAALSLAAFAVIVSARTSGWAGDYFAHHGQYRYAVGVNVVVCAYSIAQSFGEIRRLVSPTFIFRSTSSYYCSLFLDQVLAYLLMSASSAAASRNDLWVSRFGTDAFNRKISSALWLSFIGFMMLALNALISTANLFSMI